MCVSETWIFQHPSNCYQTCLVFDSQLLDKQSQQFCGTSMACMRLILLWHAVARAQHLSLGCSMIAANISLAFSKRKNQASVLAVGLAQHNLWERPVCFLDCLIFRNLSEPCPVREAEQWLPWFWLSLRPRISSIFVVLFGLALDTRHTQQVVAMCATLFLEERA